MEYNSFYGGRRGASFIIVKRYDTIQQMTQDFAKGAQFTDVNFDQYVIIDNKNRNDPDNGKLFRRGYDFDSNRQIVYKKIGNNISDIPAGQQDNFLTEAYGAEYVGTIIGSPGKSPLLRMADIGSILDERYKHNPTLKFIQSLDLKLAQYYNEYYNIRSGELIGKYNDEITHLNTEIEHVRNNIPGMDDDDKARIIEELEATIVKYQNLIDELEDHIPDIQEKIDILLEQIHLYIQTPEDRDPRFLNELQTDWRWDRVTGTGKFIKYKFKRKIVDEHEIYALINEELIIIGDEDIAYSSGTYRATPDENDPYLDIVPGKFYEIDSDTGQIIQKFNDVIEYACVTVPNDENNTRTDAWIGFKFPYLVNEFETDTIDQYEGQGDQANFNHHTSKIERIDLQNHPFYEKWKIYVPRGIHGTDVVNLSIENETIDPDTGIGSGPLGLYYQLRTYYYLDENNQQKGKRGGQVLTRQFIASYDSIENIQIDSDGLVTINYTGSKEDNIYYLDFIKSIEIDHQNHRIIYHHTYQSDSTQSDYGLPYDTYEDFDYVYDVIIDQDENGNEEKGTIIFKHLDNTKDNIHHKYLKVINELQKLQPWKYDLIYNITDNKGNPVKDTFEFEYIDKFRIVSEEESAQTGKTAGVYYHISNTPDVSQNYRFIGAIDIQQVDEFQGFEFNAETGQLYTTWKNKEPETCGDPIKYPKEIRYVSSSGQFQYKTSSSEDWITMAGSIQYPIRFKYDKNTGQILYKKNTDPSASSWTRVIEGDTLQYPVTLSYNKTTGIITSKSNKNNIVEINTAQPIEYITNITHHKINNSGIEYGLYATSNKGNETGPIYTINKSANEVRLTSDFYIIAKYNDLDAADYEAVFGQNWEYNKNDQTYAGKGWVNLGCPGKRIHEYDISLISRNDIEQRGIPSPLKTGGISFIVESDDPTSQPYIPIDYYDPNRANQIDEQMQEICAISEDEQIPQNLVEGGVAFIVTHEIEYVTLIFNENYEEGQISTVTVEKDSIFTNFSTPERLNYDFIGWFDASEDGQRITEYEATQGKTFYAHWIVLLQAQEEQNNQGE